MKKAVGTEIKRSYSDRSHDRLQIKAKHKKALTVRQRETFLATLARTCNVFASARAARRQAQLFYHQRRRDGGFRAAWMEALREGYDFLELEMVHRARFGTRKDVFHQGVKTATTRVHCEATALRLLHLHRATVSGLREEDHGGARRGADAVFADIVARMQEIRARDAKAGGCSDRGGGEGGGPGGGQGGGQSEESGAGRADGDGGA